MGRDGHAAGLWERLHGRNRILVTNLLLAAAVLVVVGQLARLWNAWRQSGQEGMFQGVPELEASRVIGFAEALRFSRVQIGVLPAAFGALAALAVLVLAAHETAARLPLAWRRFVVGGTVLVAALTLGQALIHLYVTLYTHTSMSGSEVDIYGLNDWGTTLGVGLTAAVEALVATAIMLLGLAWWPGAVGRSGLLPDDEDDDLAQPRSQSAEEATGSAPGFTPPSARPRATGVAGGLSADRTGSEAAPAGRPPRLRPDGSSESGYDEFRFGR